jgi:hypothetical protein
VREVAAPWWSDDDQLLAALEDAVRAAEEVPAELVEAGRAAFAWQGIDEELAELSYDSAVQEGLLASVRADHAALRALTFTAPELTIELEVGPDALLGQIVPARPGSAEAHLVSGEVVTARIDETGCFVLRPVPSGAFRLRCESAGVATVTSWVTL